MRQRYISARLMELNRGLVKEATEAWIMGAEVSELRKHIMAIKYDNEAKKEKIENQRIKLMRYKKQLKALDRARRAEKKT